VSVCVNRVVIVGNLTRDPELRVTAGGTAVCSLRVAVNDRVKDPTSGEWGDKPNYIDVDVFGAQGERCAQYLAKGRQVAIDGRLRWREWQTPDSAKREAVSVVAESVQFLGAGASITTRVSEGRSAAPTAPATTTVVADDDLPF